MAAYAATVVVDERFSKKLFRSRKGVLTGQVTITNYNQALAEITDITKYFRRLDRVMLTSTSSGGNTGEWVEASKSIKCRVTTTGAEVATDVGTIGTFDFVAFGVAR